MTCGPFNYDQAGLFAITAAPTTLVKFADPNAAPNAAQSSTLVSGLQVGESLFAIDFRPATGDLYQIGQLEPPVPHQSHHGRGDAGRKRHVLDPAERHGVRLRFQSGGGSHQGGEQYRSEPPAEPQRRDRRCDAAINGSGTLTIVAVGYWNNVAGAVTTTAYGINASGDRLVTIGGVNGAPSANGGTIFDVGSLGVDTNNVAGLDIARNGTAYALLTVGVARRYYTVNLTTGAATLGSGFVPNTILDLAILEGNLRFQLAAMVSPTFAGTLTNTATISSASEGCSTAATATTTVPCPTITVNPIARAGRFTRARAYSSTTMTQSGGRRAPRPSQ